MTNKPYRHLLPVVALSMACRGSATSDPVDGGGGAGAGSAGAAGGPSGPPTYGPSVEIGTVEGGRRTAIAGSRVVATQASGVLAIFPLEGGSATNLPINAVTTVTALSPTQVAVGTATQNTGIGTVDLLTNKYQPVVSVWQTIIGDVLPFESGFVVRPYDEVAFVTANQVKSSVAVPGVGRMALRGKEVFTVTVTDGTVWRIADGVATPWLTGLVMPYAITTLNDDLVVAEFTPGGRVLRLSGGATGEIAEVLASDLNRAFDLLQRGGYLYWTEYGDCESMANGRVAFMGPDKTIQVLAADQACARGLAVSDDAVVWMRGFDASDEPTSVRMAPRL